MEERPKHKARLNHRIWGRFKVYHLLLGELELYEPHEYFDQWTILNAIMQGAQGLPVDAFSPRSLGFIGGV